MDKNKGKKSSFKPKDSKFKNTYKRKTTPNTSSQATPEKKITPKPSGPKLPKSPDDIRLNKYIANSGVCSRREADIYIQSGNVRVNGEVIAEMGKVIKQSDEVYFDGVLLTPGKKEYVLLNKPKNFSTSSDDETGLRNVLDLVRGASKSHLQPVGRMDKNTTGLLLFTNDNDLLAKFSASNQKTTKIYQLSLTKNLKYEDLEKISNGVVIDGYKISVEEVSYIENEAKSEIGIKMKTPNIKVIRNIFEHLGYDVTKIDRVSFAGLTKKNLPRGNWRFLERQEVINLKNM